MAGPSAGRPGLQVVGAQSRGMQWLCRGLQLDAPAAVLGAGEAPAQLAQRWAESFAEDPSLRALLVYRPPWSFLEDELAASAGQGAAQRVETARAALQLWQAQHEAVSRLARTLGERAMLLNCERAMEPARLVAAIEARLGVRRGWAHGEAAPGESPHEPVFRQVVGALAPACLALYARLESSAEMLGAEPDFGGATTGGGNAFVGEVLRLVARQAELEAGVATARSRGQALQSENALYLLQLEQLEQELEHYYDQDREKAVRLAELEQRVARASAPLARRLALRAERLRGSTLAVLTSTRRLMRANGRRLLRQMRAVRGSGLFDESWYVEKYPDVAAARIDPVEHYLRFGAAEGRNPSAAFDTRHYLAANPDVAAGDTNPLLHYIEFGRAEGREPRPSRAARARTRQ